MHERWLSQEGEPRQMDSSLVRKIEKAKDYAVQPGRVRLTQCKAEFRGENGDHTITYEAGKWDCSCDYFMGRGTCSHTMAMQMILEGVVSLEPVASS